MLYSIFKVIWISISVNYFDAFFFCTDVFDDDLLYVADTCFRTRLRICVFWCASQRVLISCQGKTRYALVLNTFFRLERYLGSWAGKKCRYTWSSVFWRLRVLTATRCSAEHDAEMQRWDHISPLWTGFLTGVGVLTLPLKAKQKF